MARFQNMPDDILVVILRFISHDALPAIAQVSTSFNRCATLPLYRFVHLWDVRWRIQRPPEFPDWIQGTHPPCSSISHAARRDTRIFHLDLFLRTMRESRSLRNSVIGASFDCQILEHDDQVISEIVQLLSSSTRFIHLRPLRYNPGSEYLSCLTSLEIEADHLGSDYDQAYAERDKLYALFCLSNLQSLSVIGVRCWGCFGKILDSPRAGSSNITSLLFRSSVHAGPDLFDVLTWPKALISFRFELQVDDHMTFGNRRDIMRGGEFSAALLPQASTLEEIYIYGDSEGDNCGYDLTKTVDLRPFTNLRHVGLHLSLMMVYISDAEFCEEPLETFPRMYEILPPALEQLQIEMRNEFPPTSFFDSEPSWGLDLGAGELSQTVCEIMQNKKDRYPRLRDIIFVQSGSFTGTNLEDISGCSELLECSKSTEVRVSWPAGNYPPLFSA